MFMTMTMLMFLNFLVMFSSHPLSLGALIILQSLSIAVLSSFILPSSWFSYILVLIFLGGMLILFIYVSSMAANEKLSTTFSYFPPFLILSLSLSWLLFSKPVIHVSCNSFNYNSFDALFSSSMIPMSSFIILYLFIVLVAVVKIVKWWGGALRPIK